jgi:hypothetical protein
MHTTIRPAPDKSGVPLGCGPRRGEPAGISRHRRRREKLCPECREAGRRQRFWPLDWAAVERAVTGRDAPRLRPAERRAAVAILDRHGRSAATIAELIGCSERTIQRARARNAVDPPDLSVRFTAPGDGVRDAGPPAGRPVVVRGIVRWVVAA